jgi:hypothetical protein
VNEWFTWIKDPAKPRSRAKRFAPPTIAELHPPERVSELQAAGCQMTQVLREENDGRVWLRWGRPHPTVAR